MSAVDIRDLRVTFGGVVRAVDGVTLSIERGEVVALIGESGSGKSVTLRSLMRLHPPRATKMEGTIAVEGRDVLAMTPRALADYRGPIVSMIFQEPLLALDPVYTVGEQIMEIILRHEKVSRKEARARALALFERVRIPSPERRLDAYPHEMSGGMRQRAMIALALACRPKVLLADEPTTALDATVQIQILLLLRELQRDLGLSIIFVTHDLGAAVEVADRIAVMYAGRIVEEGTARELIRNPRHPYTIGLLKSRAHGVMEKGTRLDAIPGAPPDLARLPPGCSFAPRCAAAIESCQIEQPPSFVVEGGHRARCFRWKDAPAQLGAQALGAA
ncbi:ABC transporter ATP-binding protein [Enterovirga rhinocerotis]|uniref:Peptide/nickel transport system ATP-binding protein n=1 Tax=Enterovirga rhinocerotis TaxID=1339210 RepID=A0A4R7BV55_9HYPH|nr:ABC transporter ATP-binding protein [Enterovirga rhinocerotis]TDR89704.1 peptide/nickel transport system ATP-binding protein [Enterovirga rhinocerotis]